MTTLAKFVAVHLVLGLIVVAVRWKLVAGAVVLGAVGAWLAMR